MSATKTGTGTIFETGRQVSWNQAHRIWYARQGLADPQPRDIAEVVRSTGWLRTFGGNAYISVRARVAGFHRGDLERAVFAQEEVVNVPSVHSCVMLVPMSEARTSLTAAVRPVERDVVRMAARCGFELSELDALDHSIVTALQPGALTADELRRALPAGAIRDLGETGKKLGDSSTLTIALRRLAARGVIQRLPVDDRLDSNRLRYRLFATPPPGNGRAGRADHPGHTSEMTDTDGDADSLAVTLVTSFLKWAGPATVEEINKWTDVGKRRVQAALAACGAEAVALETGEGAWVEAWVEAGDPYLADAVPPAASPFAFIPVDDNLQGHRNGLAGLLPASHRDVVVGGEQLAGLRWLGYHLLVEEGMLIGLWEWHPLEKQIEWRPFGVIPAAARKAIAAEADQLGAFIRDQLGDLRMSSLDTQKELLKRVAAIRALGD